MFTEALNKVKELVKRHPFVRSIELCSFNDNHIFMVHYDYKGHNLRKPFEDETQMLEWMETDGGPIIK